MHSGTVKMFDISLIVLDLIHIILLQVYPLLSSGCLSVCMSSVCVSGPFPDVLYVFFCTFSVLAQDCKDRMLSLLLFLRATGALAPVAGLH